MTVQSSSSTAVLERSADRFWLENSEVYKALRASASFFFLCGAVWLAAYAANRRLPYILPGSTIMYNAKEKFLETGTPLDMSKPVRVLVMGNSKVLSGFVPADFERAVPGSSAYNCGQPDSVFSVRELSSVVRRGQVPTHVLLTLEWNDTPTSHLTPLRFTGSDQAIMDDLFPFRHLVRNGWVFLVRSRSFGGIANFYRRGQSEQAQMLRDHGYFFISDQSRFPNDQLPADFRLDKDAPNRVIYRSPNLSTNAFRDLHELAVQYGIKILIVPYYLREGELAPPGMNQELASALRPYPEFTVVGNEYELLDNRYFSDIAHLNPAGARVYTGLLSGIVNKELASRRGGNAF